MSFISTRMNDPELISSGPGSLISLQEVFFHKMQNENELNMRSCDNNVAYYCLKCLLHNAYLLLK